jgi:hypothetical protein
LTLGILLRTIFPARRGTTLRCQRCDYNLTGIDCSLSTARCPECGAHLHSPRAIIRGERRRSTWLIGSTLLLGLLAVSAAVVTGYSWGRSIDTYRWSPTAWVIGDTFSPTQAVSDRGFRELFGRYEARKLSEEQLAALADRALAQRATQAVVLPGTHAAAVLLGRMLNDGRLSSEQESRLLDNLCAVQVSVRTPLVEGMDASLQFFSLPIAPGGFRTTWELSELTIDGVPHKPRFELRKFESLHGGVEVVSGDIRVVGLPAGEHRHAFRMTVQIRHSMMRTGPPLFERSVRVETPIDVVAGDVSDYVVGVDAPELREEFRNAIDEVRVYETCNDQSSEYQVQVDLVLSDPIPLWFIGYGEIEAGGARIRIGANSVVPGFHQNVWQFHGEFSDGLPDRVNFVVRADRQWAEQFAEFSEYFAGEIRLDDVPVTRMQRVTERRPANVRGTGRRTRPTSSAGTGSGG